MPAGGDLSGAWRRPLPRHRLAIGCAVGLGLALATGLAAQEHRVAALRILRTTPLIDGHNDLPHALRKLGAPDSIDLAGSVPRLHTDLPRLRAGGVGAQFWAAYVPVGAMSQDGSGPGPAVWALEQIDLIHRLCERYGDTFAPARTATDIERNFRAGRISCLIGIEGGHALEGSLGALRAFHRLGARYLTLTHNRTLAWADAATDTARHGGLTPFGEDVVREMNRLGMLVDLSHVSDGTMLDALRVSRAPVIYSHSSARALNGHARNVPDSILRLVPANGGVVMVNFYSVFVDDAVRRHALEVGRRASALRAAGAAAAAVADSTSAWMAGGPRATLERVADHIEHIRRVAGVDHVGLGSDYDGVDYLPDGLEDVSRFPDLIAELLRRGWSEEDLRKLVGLNVLRVMREAERVAGR